MNRLTAKTYSTGMATVTYTYDSTMNNSFGKGRRTGMVDGSGIVTWRYDNWGRVIEERRMVDGIPYTTTFAYDAASRLTSVTYPTGETATQGYNGRGLPYSLGSSVNGFIVSGVQYNSLALPTQTDLGNNTRTTYGYWDTGGQYDTSGGYFGKLWQIKTVKDPSGSPATLQWMKHTWDAGGNLSQRDTFNTATGTWSSESFSYDFLDRLKTAGGPYATENYTYATIGNMTSKNGISYTYGSSKPHAVTQVGTATYIYDANGNMTTRGGASLTWDAENRLTGVTGSASYVYDGNGFRVKKTEGGQTILYINQYYEKNLTTSTVTLYYYLGGKMVAYKEGSSLSHIHQDHLTGTSVTTDASGNDLGAISYLPFGTTRSFSNPLPAQKFTSQRLDDAGLYYYGARYYDPGLGRFISADTVVPDFKNPQELNRYSYVLNNPLKYVDPTGSESALLSALAAYKNNEVSLQQYLAIYNALTSRWGWFFLYGRNRSDLERGATRGIETRGADRSTQYSLPPSYGYSSWKGFNEYEKLLGIGFDKMDQFTQIGVIWGIMSGATPRLGPDGTVLVEGVSPNSDTSWRMSWLGGKSITFGNVILTKKSTIDPETLAHEMVHVEQYRNLGRRFMDRYFYEVFSYWFHDSRPLEIDANYAASLPDNIKKYQDWLNSNPKP